MKIFNKFKSLILISLLFSFFINLSEAMTLSDFGLEQFAKSEKIKSRLNWLEGFSKLDYFLRKDCNFKFFIETLNQAKDSLTWSLWQRYGMDDSDWFVDPVPGVLENYAQRSVEDNCKVIIIGDLHGNYYALYEIIKNLIERGILSNDLKIQDDYKIVSLGDYIDRGKGSAQVLLLLIILKLINPENYIMLKGNHECESTVDSILTNLNVNTKESIEFLKHYDFITDILKSYSGRCDEKFFSTVSDLFKVLFNLLPTIFYLQVNDKTFMFNHGGYSEDFLFVNQILPQFLSSSCKYAILEFENKKELKARASLLCGDIYPEKIFKDDLHKLFGRQIEELEGKLKLCKEYLDLDFPEKEFVDKRDIEGLAEKLRVKLTDLEKKKRRSFVNGRRGGFTCSDLYVSESMESSEITAKFFGHTHDLIKRVYFYKNDKDFNVYKKYQDGFMSMGCEKNLIFNLISGEIASSPLNARYYPSYLELIINQDNWYIQGNSLANDAADFESKLVPYCYNL